MKRLAFTIPATSWTVDGPPSDRRVRLVAAMTINGIPFLAYATRVDPDELGMSRVPPQPMTMTITGCEYVVIIRPRRQ